ncbi:DUF7134 domain-containing protein [Acidipropionibacterium virtanenii]|uniref:DUF7134 domain-containing protein n=1 Tax=Acidipropionibacterium virtanenii TaxID=2057246 RepID=UPI000DED346C
MISAGLCGLYLLRRRRPVAVFVAMSSVAGVQAVLGAGVMVSDVMLALGLYNVASRARDPVPHRPGEWAGHQSHATGQWHRRTTC